MQTLATLTLAAAFSVQAEVPNGELPEMITDRPDYTESVEVVGKSVIQTEHGITLEREGDAHTNTNRNAAEANLPRFMDQFRVLEDSREAAGTLIEHSKSQTLEGVVRQLMAMAEGNKLAAFTPEAVPVRQEIESGGTVRPKPALRAPLGRISPRENFMRNLKCLSPATECKN